MESNISNVIDVINGRWRSQILHAGVELGVFEQLPDHAALTAESIAHECGADPALLYRLLRALSSINLLHEDKLGRFSIAESGRFLRADHPQSLRAMALLEEGPVHYMAWRRLPEMLLNGIQDGFRQEFGMTLFEYTSHNPQYGATFDSAMGSYSAAEAFAVRQGLENELTGSAKFCDVGGGQGYLLAELLKDRPEANGIVFDLPQVAEQQARRAPLHEGVSGRCMYLAGDMFVNIPEADVYFLKHVLHDWNDEECLQILSKARQAAKSTSRLFICEWIVPRAGESHFAKIIDIHMLCMCSGRERTLDEYASLLASTGWQLGGTRSLEGTPLGIIDASAC